VQNQTPLDAPPEAETRLLTASLGPTAICPGWQVASDRLQWVLQRWQAPRWRDRAFCRTRAGLELRIRELLGKEHQAAVAHLPDWHPDVADVPAVNSEPAKAVSSPAMPSAAVHLDRYVERHGPTPGALQGDDYPIEFDANSEPVLPACLDRRVKPEQLEAAAA